jgi:hypothetical protein
LIGRVLDLVDNVGFHPNGQCSSGRTGVRPDRITSDRISVTQRVCAVVGELGPRDGSSGGVGVANDTSGSVGL